jgi:hypothetical protein
MHFRLGRFGLKNPERPCVKLHQITAHTTPVFKKSEGGRDSSHVDIAWANIPPRRRDSRFRHANRRNSRRDTLLVVGFAVNDFQTKSRAQIEVRSFSRFMETGQPQPRGSPIQRSNCVHPPIVHHRTRPHHLVSPAASGHGGGEGKGLPLCVTQLLGNGPWCFQNAGPSGSPDRTSRRSAPAAYYQPGRNRHLFIFQSPIKQVPQTLTRVGLDESLPPGKFHKEVNPGRVSSAPPRSIPQLRSIVAQCCHPVA